MADKNHQKQHNKKDVSPQHTGKPNARRAGKVAAKASASVAKGLFFTVGKMVFATFLIVVIISCIVGTALTVFVMNYIKTEGIDLSNVEIFSNSYIYGQNGEGEAVVVQKLKKAGGNQEWVSLDKIPQKVQDAFVYTEDKRFMDHDGVDWQRTIVSFVRMLLAGNNSQGGGSTISQQLIKNLNGDFANEDRTLPTKIKEILGALQLEQHNSKSTVLEAYLNCIDLGNGNIGVQAASRFYFDKDVSQLTLAEAASLAVVPKSPSNINILRAPERNKERRNYYTLPEMYNAERITQAEFDEAKQENLQAFDWSTADETKKEGENAIFNWYVDNTVRQVKEDLLAEGVVDSTAEAQALINGGGLRIYTKEDISMQKYLEEFFLNDDNFIKVKGASGPPEGAMTIMDYEGYVHATVGSRNEKEGSLSFDRATMDKRSPGSTMKPITAYALAIDTNLVNWSTLLKDEYKVKLNGNSTPNWPKNYDRKFRGMVTVTDALKVSLNTIPVDLMMQLGIDRSYNFLRDTLGITTLGSENDRFYGLTLGMTDTGIILDQLAASYTIFGNDGRYNSAKYYTKVVDMNGAVLLDNQPENRLAIGADSAYVVNRLLYRVVNASGGTGTKARLDNGIEVIGKTGTSDNTYERSFVGLTPYYVAAVRFGYDEEAGVEKRSVSGKVDPPATWKKVMTNVLKGYEPKKFEEILDHTDVVEKAYCTETGLLAGYSCPKAMGYYKRSNLPPTCSLSHYIEPEIEEQSPSE